MNSLLFVRRIRVTFQRTRLQNGFAKLGNRIGHFDLDLREQPPQIVHDTIQIQLSRPDQHVLTTFFDFGRNKWVRLVDTP